MWAACGADAYGYARVRKKSRAWHWGGRMVDGLSTDGHRPAEQLGPRSLTWWPGWIGRAPSALEKNSCLYCATARQKRFQPRCAKPPPRQHPRQKAAHRPNESASVDMDDSSLSGGIRLPAIHSRHCELVHVREMEGPILLTQALSGFPSVISRSNLAAASYHFRVLANWQGHRRYR